MEDTDDIRDNGELEKKVRRWVFTWFYYTDEDVTFLTKWPKGQKMNYLCFGEETCPETGRMHLQGYIELDTPMKGYAVKRLFGRDKGLGISCRLAAANSNREANLRYCGKENLVEVIHKIPARGHGVDKSRAQTVKDLRKGDEEIANKSIMLLEQKRFVDKMDDDMLREQLYDLKEMTLSEFTMCHPKTGIKDHFQTKSIKKMFDAETCKSEMEEKLPENLLHYKVWRELINAIDNDSPPDRAILWYYNTEAPKRAGGKGNGKSLINDWLAVNRGALCLGNAGTGDLAHSWNGERIITFNFTKTTEEYINYGAIEALKDGNIYSKKYDSGAKVFMKPWVIVFANFYPDTDSMMEDRWHIWEIEDGVDNVFEKYREGMVRYKESDLDPVFASKFKRVVKVVDAEGKPRKKKVNPGKKY